MLTRSIIVFSFAVAGTPAFAHPGGHSHMSIREIVQHYAEPDHLAFLALVVIVGVLAYRFGRRIEAKANAKPARRDGGRP